MQNAIVAPKIAAYLDFATGKVGYRYPLVGVEAESAFAENLGRHKEPVNVSNTAFCGDEREYLAFEAMHDGFESMEDYILRVVAPTTFGGLGLSATKAVVAARASIVRDAKSVSQAYKIVSHELEIRGQEDGGHDDCGASINVEKSVANAIEPEPLRNAMGLFVPTTEEVVRVMDQNTENKRQLLEGGFYGDWDPENHKDYLTQKFPYNFAHVKIDHDDHETHGHNGSGVLAIPENEAGTGFAKNKFIHDTGQSSFAVTIWKMRQAADILGASNEERQAIFIGFLDDTLHVGAGIVKPGMPVFA